MKNLSIILIICSLLSCGENKNKAQETQSNVPETPTEFTARDVTKNKNTGIFLCKINGNDWYYTSGNGLVSENSSTKVRTATIGFTKQLEKGTESIQLEYDVKKNVLNSVLVELKRPTKDSKLKTAFYTQYATHLDKNPEASMSGTVTLDETNRIASGKAIFTLLINYDMDQFSNPEDLMITVTDLSFSGIEYSDTDDLKKMMKK